VHCIASSLVIFDAPRGRQFLECVLTSFDLICSASALNEPIERSMP
jgi:hypothetical protein